MKIKVWFILPTPDFKKSIGKELPVEMNIPDSMSLNGNIEYCMTIPDYMFNELANSEPQFRTEYDINNNVASGLFSDRTVTKKFKKTQTSILISSLQEYISSLTQILNDRYSIETETMKKKLFIHFNHSENHTTSGLSGAYTGKLINQNFRYFVGYEVMSNKFNYTLSIKKEITKKYITKILYASPNSSLRKNDTGFKEKEGLFLSLLQYNQSIESFEKEYSILDWTEERENFCEKIQNTFINVNNELDNFLKDIDDNKMNMLISNGLKFLGE
jgi:hypothetical protein